MTSSNGNISALLPLCAGNSPLYSPHKGQWRGALMFPLICTWTNGWVNNWDAGDLRPHHAHYDVIVKYFIAYALHIPKGSKRLWYHYFLCYNYNADYQTKNQLSIETVASFIKEVNPWLVKRPLISNGRLANRGLTSLVKEATGDSILI